jgi:hypothetical protein
VRVVDPYVGAFAIVVTQGGNIHRPDESALRVLYLQRSMRDVLHARQREAQAGRCINQPTDAAGQQHDDEKQDHAKYA